MCAAACHLPPTCQVWFITSKTQRQFNTLCLGRAISVPTHLLYAGLAGWLLLLSTPPHGAALPYPLPAQNNAPSLPSHHHLPPTTCLPAYSALITTSHLLPPFRTPPTCRTRTFRLPKNWLPLWHYLPAPRVSSPPSGPGLGQTNAAGRQAAGGARAERLAPVCGTCRAGRRDGNATRYVLFNTTAWHQSVGTALVWDLIFNCSTPPHSPTRPMPAQPHAGLPCDTPTPCYTHAMPHGHLPVYTPCGTGLYSTGGTHLAAEHSAGTFTCLLRAVFLL